MESKKFTSIDEYIATFPEGTRTKLEQVRETIKQAAPGAKEIISYKMPAVKANGVLVYFAGYKEHIGFYPTGSGIKVFEKELAGYKYSKGAVQFPFDKPIDLDLISRITRFRFDEDAAKAKTKRG